jgi:phospholipid/cholesterol/gamma-HCH transport system ATP-binding protein
MAAALVRLEQVVTRFGDAVVHDGVSLEIDAGQVVALIGGSGTGKSVLLREMVGLQRPSAGRGSKCRADERLGRPVDVELHDAQPRRP